MKEQRIRLAFVKTVPRAKNENVVRCTYAESGKAIWVHCNICGGTKLSEAVPRLKVNDWIVIVDINGNWFCTTVFQASLKIRYGKL